MKKMQIAVAIMVACLMATRAHATDILTAVDGNWATPGTWTGAVQPGLSDFADLRHDVTVTTDVGEVDRMQGTGSGSLAMNGGTLVVNDGDWLAIPTVSLSNGATLDFQRFSRIRGTWTVDDSALSFGTVPQSFILTDFRGTGTDMTIRNGSTFWTPAR
jgi:hypothetical protein